MYAIRFLCVVLFTVAAAGAGETAPAADINALVGKLAHEEFSEREAASKALLNAGEKAVAALEKLLKETKDADLRSRAATILELLRLPAGFAALTPDERELAQLPFESTVSDNGNKVSFNNYGRGNDFICDFGNVRVVIEDQPYNGGGGAVSVLGLASGPRLAGVH